MCNSWRGEVKKRNKYDCTITTLLRNYHECDMSCFVKRSHEWMDACLNFADFSFTSQKCMLFRCFCQQESFRVKILVCCLWSAFQMFTTNDGFVGSVWWMTRRCHEGVMAWCIVKACINTSCVVNFCDWCISTFTWELFLSWRLTATSE